MTKNTFELVKSSIIEHGGIDEMTIAQKSMCVWADGALVMQGHKNGLVTKLKDFATPYIVDIHYMAHRMNLAFGIVSDYPLIYKVEDLIKEIYRNFCWIPKWFREFQQFDEGLTNGIKMLKDNDTRLISLDGPGHRVFF